MESPRCHIFAGRLIILHASRHRGVAPGIGLGRETTSADRAVTAFKRRRPAQLLKQNTHRKPSGPDHWTRVRLHTRWVPGELVPGIRRHSGMDQCLCQDFTWLPVVRTLLPKGWQEVPCHSMQSATPATRASSQQVLHAVQGLRQKPRSTGLTSTGGNWLWETMSGSYPGTRLRCMGRILVIRDVSRDAVTDHSRQVEQPAVIHANLQCEGCPLPANRRFTADRNSSPNSDVPLARWAMCRLDQRLPNFRQSALISGVFHRNFWNPKRFNWRLKYDGWI